MPTFDPLRRFLVVPALIDAEGGLGPDLPPGVTNWVGNAVLPNVYVVMTTDEITDPPRAGVDFDPMVRAREIRESSVENLKNILAIRMNNDASDTELDAVQAEMGVDASRRLTRAMVNSWLLRGQ